MSRSARRSCSISLPGTGSSNLAPGGVSERPKEHTSKACVGESPPWVQIPPPPPDLSTKSGLARRPGQSAPGGVSGLCLSSLHGQAWNGPSGHEPIVNGFAPYSQAPAAAALPGVSTRCNGTSGTKTRPSLLVHRSRPTIGETPSCWRISDVSRSPSSSDLTLAQSR